MDVPPRSFYTGLVAELYGALRSETYDPAPYERFVRRYGEPALELGCGDGVPMLDLIAAGLNVEGLDSSPDMLDRCLALAAGRGLAAPTLHQAAIEDMDLRRTFRSIYLAGATFNLLPDDETALAGLMRIAAHLEPDGVAMVPLFIPAATPLSRLGGARERAGALGEVLRFTYLTETRDEAARTQVAEVRYELVRGGAVVESAERKWVLHWHTQDGFAALSERAGLKVRAVLDDQGRPATATESSFTFLLQPIAGA